MDTSILTLVATFVLVSAAAVFIAIAVRPRGETAHRQPHPEDAPERSPGERA